MSVFRGGDGSVLVAGEEDFLTLLALAALGFRPEEMRAVMSLARGAMMAPGEWIRLMLPLAAPGMAARDGRQTGKTD